MRVHLWDLSCLSRVVRSPLGFRGPPLDSWCIAAAMNRASSQVEVETSGFLSISDFDRRVSAELEQESQASSCVEEWNSTCLSRCSQGDRTLVALYLEPAGFSGRCNWGVSAPSCCDFIHRVTFEEVSGHWVLIKSSPGNWSLSECGTTHNSMSGISS